ncbi:MAG: hypothetical protein F6J86_32575 [Symploca sp. SIO1B1]|nr:hypothetical protein [Symploca sp. SIO1B1]
MVGGRWQVVGGRWQVLGGSPDEKFFYHQVMKVASSLFPVAYSLFPSFLTDLSKYLFNLKSKI